MITDHFEELMRGKSEDNKLIIKEIIKGLAKDIMTALDIRKEGNLDVCFIILTLDIVVLI